MTKRAAIQRQTLKPFHETITSMIRFAFAALLLASPLAAQSGKIEGDLYLLTKSSDVKKGAANSVFLFRDPATLGKGWDRVCAAASEATANAAGTAGSDSTLSVEERIAGMARALDGAPKPIRAYLATVAFKRSPTGVNAHYSFTGLAAGRYVLFASMPLFDDIHDWFVPVTVKNAQTVRVDLDNSNVHDGEWGCKTLPMPIAGRK